MQAYMLDIDPILIGDHIPLERNMLSRNKRKALLKEQKEILQRFSPSLTYLLGMLKEIKIIGTISSLYCFFLFSNFKPTFRLIPVSQIMIFLPVSQIRIPTYFMILLLTSSTGVSTLIGLNLGHIVQIIGLVCDVAYSKGKILDIYYQNQFCDLQSQGFRT